jgi:hypothetical protein
VVLLVPCLTVLLSLFTCCKAIVHCQAELLCLLCCDLSMSAVCPCLLVLLLLLLLLLQGQPYGERA